MSYAVKFQVSPTLWLSRGWMRKAVVDQLTDQAARAAFFHSYEAAFAQADRMGGIVVRHPAEMALPLELFPQDRNQKTETKTQKGN